MADNPTIDNGALTDYTVSTDEGTGGHVQRVKLAYSADGSETHVTADADGLLVNLGANNDVTVSGVSTAANQSTIIGHLDGVEGLLGTIDADTGSIATAASTLAGAIAGNEMQVDVVSSALPSGAATAANQSTGNASLATIAGAVSGTEMQVDVLTMPTVAVTGTFYQATQPVSAASLPLPSGAATAAKQPALGTAGTPSADVISIQGVASGTVVPVSDGGGALTVDGTIAATQSGTWAVDLGATDNAVLDAMAASLAIVDNVVFGAGTEAAALRVTLATDSTGVVSVDDNGGSLTVDGTVTANLSATDNAVLDTIDAVLDTIKTDTAAAVVDLAAIEVLLGTIDADTGGILTAVQTLDNAISGSEMQVDVVGALPAGTNNIGDVDVLSVVPGTAATSLGKAIDSAAGATDTGVAILAVRDDSLSTLTPIEGDYAPLRVSSTGALHVTGAGGGTQYQEDAAHTTGDTGTMALAVRKDTAAALAGTDGDYTPLITDANGALHVNVASGSVTASGTITAELSATDNAVLDDIAAKLGTIDTDTGNIATSVGAVTPGTRVSLIDVDESEDEIKSTAGTLYSLIVTNLASSTRFVRLYNATAASTTVGTTTPWRGPFAIPAGAGMVFTFERGLAFSTALCIAATTGVADSDTGAPGANEVVADVVYV